jgi:hypothetical protein
MDWLSIVKVWDLVGEDQSVKGDFKVIGGRMQVQHPTLLSTGRLIA